MLLVYPEYEDPEEGSPDIVSFGWLVNRDDPQEAAEVVAATLGQGVKTLIVTEMGGEAFEVNVHADVESSGSR
jgi:hypothetical protein